MHPASAYSVQNRRNIIGGGLIQNVNLSDAIYEPLAARRSLDARLWSVQAAKNDAADDAAQLYASVHEARGRYAAALYTAAMAAFYAPT